MSNIKISKLRFDTKDSFLSKLRLSKTSVVYFLMMYDKGVGDTYHLTEPAIEHIPSGEWCIYNYLTHIESSHSGLENTKNILKIIKQVRAEGFVIDISLRLYMKNDLAKLLESNITWRDFIDKTVSASMVNDEDLKAVYVKYVGLVNKHLN